MKDDDLSALLPDAPPPRPDRREAAIDEALRRFDGEAPSPAASRRGRPDAGQSPLWRRPQFGLVLATSLVALIALPLWMSDSHRPDVTGRNVPAVDTALAPAASEPPKTAPSLQAENMPAVPPADLSAAPQAERSEPPTPSRQVAEAPPVVAAGTVVVAGGGADAAAD